MVDWGGPYSWGIKEAFKVEFMCKVIGCRCQNSFTLLPEYKGEFINLSDDMCDVTTVHSYTQVKLRIEKQCSICPVL